MGRADSLMQRERKGTPRTGFVAVAATVAAMMIVPAAALAHVERSTFWPDPAPDGSVHPAAGGKVPEYRPLDSALKGKPPGDTWIVCQDDSLKLAKQAIRDGRKGFKVRPSEDTRHLSKRKAGKLKKLNKRLDKRCSFDSIQDAVTASGNNDRIVIMPGTYTEPNSLAKPENDPACADLTSESDRGMGAVSYRYQTECPNDQNLIAVIGREAADVAPPVVTPSTDRHGIPNAGKCIRCNLQIEGSGVRPEDVTIDAGNGPRANGPLAGQGKDVGIRAERADGFYLRNVTIQHAEEHGVYPVETDGYAIDRVKLAYNHEYGHLAFASDHGLLKNCNALGSGDAGVYPGSAPQTGEQTVEKTRRYNTEITKCDLHHNTLGHSGSMGDAIHLHHNDVYDNAAGIVVDSFSSAGHFGYPQDSTLVERNRIYSNNFNPYLQGSDVVPTTSLGMVGTGAVIGGGNGNVYRDNRIFDNWRRGVVLISVPDPVACPDPPDAPNATCSAALFSEQSNSHRNRFFDNVMGVAPGGRERPNGVDFWWDEGGTSLPSKNNCWFDNVGSNGKESGVTGDPNPLPSDCGSSRGEGNADKFVELSSCAFEQPTCPWHETPPRPGAANRSRE
jgi:Right handed beta helix region